MILTGNFPLKADHIIYLNNQFSDVFRHLINCANAFNLIIIYDYNKF